MSDYARMTTTFEVSESGDYSSPYINPPDWVKAWTPDEAFHHARVEAALTPGTAVNTAILATCDMLAVRNLDATNFVTLTWRSAANVAVDNKVKILPGDIFVTKDITAATAPTLVADTAVCKCEVIFTGT